MDNEINHSRQLINQSCESLRELLKTNPDTLVADIIEQVLGRLLETQQRLDCISHSH